MISSFFKNKTKRSDKYKRFIRSLGCLICGRRGSECHHEPLFGRGTGIKGPDKESIPLCQEHHAERHVIGRSTFFKKYGVDMAEEVKYYQELYKTLERKWNQ